jgi:hypothetical protein
MRRFGANTFRWVNGFDIVPTLPPDLPALESYLQLPAERTLWRTLDGQCAKAAGPLLADCPAAAGGGGGGDDERARRKGGKGRDADREARCPFTLSDHRLWRALEALGGCVQRQAEAGGDACAAAAMAAILPNINRS